MSHPVVPLFDDVPETPGFRFDLRPPGGTPRPVADVRADIERLAEQGASWVVLGRWEPAAHPELAEICDVLQDVGVRGKMTTSAVGLGEQKILERLRDGGLAQLTVVFWGASPATHDARVGVDGAFDEAVEVLELSHKINRLLVTARFVLLSENHEEAAPLVEAIRQTVDRFELVRLSALTLDRDVLRAHGVPRRHALAAVQGAWASARVTHLKVYTEAFGSWPSIPMPSDTPLQPVDITLLELLRANVPVPSVLNGTWATPPDGDVSGLYFAVEESRNLHELGLQLAAYGCPPLDLPPAMGGRQLDHPPGVDGDEDSAPMRRNGVPMLLANIFEGIDTRPLPSWAGLGEGAKVAVVAGWLTDNVLALSSLPGLVDALAARGCDATLHSVWNAPFNPYDHGDRVPEGALAPSQDPERPGWRYPETAVEALANVPARVAHARRQTPAWLAGLDLSGLDAVVVPGFDNALGVLDNPTLPEDARVILPDFHLMTGIAAWHQRWLDGPSMHGGWWPSERIEVHALYPRYVRAYWRAGVPLRQVAWRPYPIDPRTFPEGPPPEQCDSLFSGGSHQRDWATLARAMHHLGDAVRPMVVHTREAVPRPLVTRGEVRLLHFYEALANSRFVVLPLDPDPRRPAGISVISMALAAGRPVIASSTLATIDHLRHGHNAILVPPNRPKALARAIQRLNDDDELLATLSAGARRAASHLFVRSWADGLVDGAPAQPSFTMDGGDTGPFYSWPA